MSNEAETAMLARRENRDIPSPALSTRFIELDGFLAGGFWPGELIILAGRPGMGKTTFAINIARKVAGDIEERAKPVAIFSLEMPKEQVTKNILAAQCGDAVPEGAKKLRNFNLSEDEYAEVVQAMRVLELAPLHIDDSSGLTIEQLRARCRRLKHRFGIGLVVVDYLQLIHPSSGGGKRGNRQEEVSEISRGLKSIARELKLPMIVLSQLNRSMEKHDDKSDKRPALSDLRDSGAIEQDADVVIMLYREGYYDEAGKLNPVNITEAMIMKNRNGALGKPKVTFFKDQLRFENYAPGYEAQEGGSN
jgi:replicative DNA helicase